MITRRERITVPALAAVAFALVGGGGGAWSSSMRPIPEFNPEMINLQSCSCHGGAIPTTSVCIEGLPATGRYDPSTTYPIKVLVNGIIQRADSGDPTAPRAGFSLQASSGTLAPVDGSTLQWTPQIVTHSGPGSLETAWNLLWTPHPTTTSTTFTLGGNTVNGDGFGDSRDRWNRGTFTFTAAPGTPDAAGRACTLPPIPLPIYVPDPP